MNVRVSFKGVALLGMVGMFVVQHHDARHAVAEPAVSPQNGEIVDGSLAEGDGRLSFLNVSSLVIVRNELTAIEIDIPLTFLSTGPDGKPTFVGMESVTVTDESIVVVFNFSSVQETAEVYTDLAQDTLSVVAENPTIFPRVTSITTYGTDLSVSISAEPNLFSTDDDGRVTLAAIRSVTISEDKFVLVFDREVETESNWSDGNVARIPTTRHTEITVTPQPNGTSTVIIVCKGTCPAGKTFKPLEKAVFEGGGSKTYYCDCR